MIYINNKILMIYNKIYYKYQILIIYKIKNNFININIIQKDLIKYD